MRVAKTGAKRRGQFASRTPNEARTWLNAAECTLCGEILFSRARHDFHCCSCTNVSVDGGFDHFKIGWKRKEPLTYRLSVPASKYDLYDDWNTMTDNFGVIALKNLSEKGYKKRKYVYKNKDNKNE